MSILNFLLVTVLVGLTNNTQVTLTDAQFEGFVQSRDDGRFVLLYRQSKIHGELCGECIKRIDFGYERGQPFPLTVTLRSGEKMDVISEHRTFVRIIGKTVTGNVYIYHPDPIPPSTRIRTRGADRSHDLTIQFLEFLP